MRHFYRSQTRHLKSRTDDLKELLNRLEAENIELPSSLYEALHNTITNLRNAEIRSGTEMVPILGTTNMLLLGIYNNLCKNLN